jgi:hypothetical protein
MLLMLHKKKIMALADRLLHQADQRPYHHPSKVMMINS